MPKKRTVPEMDGFYWEERRNGVLITKGRHNGTTLDGKDATWKEEALCIAVSYSAIDKMLYENEK